MTLHAVMASRLFPWLIVGLVGAGALALGYLTMGTNVLVALGVALVVVGVAKLFRPAGNPIVALLLIGTGITLWMGREHVPGLTVASLVGADA